MEHKPKGKLHSATAFKIQIIPIESTSQKSSRAALMILNSLYHLGLPEILHTSVPYIGEVKFSFTSIRTAIVIVS